MKNLPILILLVVSCGFKDIKSRPDMSKQTTSSVYDFTLKSISGEEINLGDYKGQKLLMVNVASECGYTPQYEDLQELTKQFGNKVTILGFPANNFGGQEPGTDAEIAKFCKSNYGVTFQMFSKISVKGEDMHPLYQWLSTPEKNGWNDKAPNWNFCKYLVNEKGELVNFFASAINPMSEEILSEVLKK